MLVLEIEGGAFNTFPICDYIEISSSNIGLKWEVGNFNLKANDSDEQ